MIRKSSIIGGPAVLLAGLAAGALSAYIASDAFGTSPIAAGTPWVERSVAPESPAQPYAIAHFLLGGRLPPAPSQVTELTATADQDGRRLTSSCPIDLTLAAGPRPRWWSVALLGGGGVLSSDRAIAESDGTIRIRISALPQPGNWLAAPVGRSIGLLFTAAGSDTGKGMASGALPLFAIKQADC